MKRARLFLLICLFLHPASLTTLAADPPSPPPQPLEGPGGSDYPHGGVTLHGPYFAEGHEGQDGFKYFLFEPAGPTPDEAVVVLFLHGYIGPFNKHEPRAYGAWIEHMARKGNVVVYAQYQGYVVTFPWLYKRNAVETWKSALRRLDTESSHVRPERDYKGDYKTAIVGHSLGGYLAAVLADEAGKSGAGFPRPYAVLSVEPGGLGIVPHTNFSNMSENTIFVIVVGDEDDVVCKSSAQFLWNETPQIEERNKDFLWVKSDHHGLPSLTADHYFPATGGFLAEANRLDALDTYGTFKLSVAAIDCAYRDTHCAFALGNGSPEQVNLGTWSDGQAVTPMTWLEDPNTIEVSCSDPTAVGCCMPAPAGNRPSEADPG